MPAARPTTGGPDSYHRPLTREGRLQALDLYAGPPDYDLAREIGKLVRDEAVPYLAVRRYKPTGMRETC